MKMPRYLIQLGFKFVIKLQYKLCKERHIDTPRW